MYRIAIDIGGTFTDLIGASEDGALVEAKVPSDPQNPEGALTAGLAELATRFEERSLTSLLANTVLIIQGTTVAINAVLQGTGAKTGLVCTGGFRDTLEIRLGYKEERYVLPYAPPPTLVPRHLRIPVTERVDKTGAVRIPLAHDEVEEAARRFEADGVEAVAICFLWSFRHPEHEQQAQELLQKLLPGVFVTTSADILPRIREYNRTSTTVLNAYVGPVCARHINQTESLLTSLGFQGRLRYLQSNGGLAEAAEVRRRPVLLLLSGPAAAPAAGLQFAGLAGNSFLTIDMGGTSFDACLVRDGLPDMRSSADVSRYRVATALIDVHTIGAGGGSIASVSEGLLEVGPASAEAHPGPACYARGGATATVTDANVVVGRLNQSALLGGRFPIDASLAQGALSEEIATPLDIDDLHQAAGGVLEVVSRNMAEAMREITVRRGHDPRDFSLVAGGGAGGLHAAELASGLGINRVVIPRIASAFCAFGAIVADLRHDYTTSYVGGIRTLEPAALARVFADIEARGRSALRDENVEESEMRFVRSLEMRYEDQVYECEIDVSDVKLGDSPDDVRKTLEDRFHQRHDDLYEYSQPGAPCEVVSLTLTAVGLSPQLQLQSASQGPTHSSFPEVVDRRLVAFDRTLPPVETPIFSGDSCHGDYALDAPAIVEEMNTTIVVPPGWHLRFHGREQAYVLEATAEGSADLTMRNE